MMSLLDISAVNEKIAARAAREGRQPFVLGRPEDVERWPPFPFPNLGCQRPKGWVQVDSWFVDKTGHGYEGEPGLTHKQFKQFKQLLQGYVRNNPGHGFAIVEEGPFQVVIVAFRPVEEIDSEQPTKTNRSERCGAFIGCALDRPAVGP